MKFLVFIFVALISLDSYAQQTANGLMPAGKMNALVKRISKTHSSSTKSRMGALGANQAISYFQPGTPTHSWILPSNWGMTMFAMTERFELPAAFGFLDSVRITFDELSGDSILVIVDPDTLIETPPGLYQ